ncbi:MAG: squalene/phytoene synthase family protein [Rhodospirillales bacterium]|nr:squalene/phytoene synthase family protein [Rhodospirillales bacterium]
MPTPMLARLRASDPDRFLTALFAPPARRETLALLYAFDHELARARAVVSVPPLALIRLQWWREVIEGAPRRHEVATPLTLALAEGRLLADDLLALVAAREIEAEAEFADTGAWFAWLEAAYGGVAVAAARLLGAPAPEAARPFGTLMGAARVLGGVIRHAREGRCLLPADALAAQGLVPEAVIATPAMAALAPLYAALAGQALARGGMRPLPRAACAAGLGAVLARRDLTRLVRGRALPEARGLGDRLAVMRAGLLGG